MSKGEQAVWSRRQRVSKFDFDSEQARIKRLSGPVKTLSREEIEALYGRKFSVKAEERGDPNWRRGA